MNSFDCFVVFGFGERKGVLIKEPDIIDSEFEIFDGSVDEAEEEV